MNPVTRCPACATLFRVTPEQLAISDGWVRCGRCQQVFDASLQWPDTTDSPPLLAAATLTSTPRSATFEADNPASKWQAGKPTEQWFSDLSEMFASVTEAGDTAGPVTPAPDVPAPEHQARDAAAPTLFEGFEDDLTRWQTERSPNLPAAAAALQTETAPAHRPATLPAAADPRPAAAARLRKPTEEPVLVVLPATEPAPACTPTADSPSAPAPFWQRRAVRGVLWLLSLGLLALLAAQYQLYQRSRSAALYAVPAVTACAAMPAAIAHVHAA